MADFNFGETRPRATQQVIQYLLNLPASGQSIRLSEDLDTTRMITTFSIGNDSQNASRVLLSVNPIFPGQPSPSFEIQPGACPVFATVQEGRQIYELQILMKTVMHQLSTDLIKIPILVWDLTQWWIAAEAPDVAVTVTAFPLAYL